MSREQKLKKLSKLLMERLQVWELPSVSEMNVYLEAATSGKLNKVLFAFYEASFMSNRRIHEIYKCQRDEKIKRLKEVYLNIIHPEE